MRSTIRAISPLFSATLILFICLICVQRAAFAVVRHSNGKIAFVSDRDGNSEIYVMNADGTNQMRLTNNPGVDDYPTWSPEGKKIAFVSQDSSGAFAIKVMNSDGANQTKLTQLSLTLST